MKYPMCSSPLAPTSYKEKIVWGQIYRARVLDLEELFAPRQGTTRKGVPIVATYHPGVPDLGGILKELHSLLHLPNRCMQAIQDLPMMALIFVVLRA